MECLGEFNRGLTIHGPFHDLIIHLCCRLSISGEQRLAFVLQDEVFFTLLCVIVGWLVVVEFLVVFLPSKDDTPADNPDTLCPFLQMPAAL